VELLCEAVADDMEEDRAEGRRRKDKGERIKEEKSAFQDFGGEPLRLIPARRKEENPASWALQEKGNK
jgi:hypothetical protein